MISAYLHELIPLNWPADRTPATFRQICRGIEMEIAPESISEDERQLLDMPTLVEDRKPAPFDRTPIGALADWCKENDEPWLERACRFFVKNPDIIVARKASSWSAETFYYEFEAGTLPGKFKIYTSGCSTFALLLCKLAEEIQERLEAIGM